MYQSSSGSGRRRHVKTTLQCAVAAAGAILLVLWAVPALLPPPPLLDGVPFSRVVEDRHGTLLRLALAGDQKRRLRVALDDIAPAAVQAMLLYEDRYFYRHPGVNPFSLVRAAVTSYLGGGRRIGGSTVTMQVARLRLGLKTSTPAGKLAQVWAALRLERHYSKREILEAYFNLAPYGGNVEGIGAAARVYFHTTPARLTPEESLALAATPQHPARRNPANGRDFQAGRAVARAVALPDGGTGIPPLRVHTVRELPFLAPHVTSELLGNAEAGERTPAGTGIVEKRPGDKGEHIPPVSRNRTYGNEGENISVVRNRAHGNEGENISVVRNCTHGCADTGERVRSTLDLPAQRVLETCIARFAARYGRYGLDNAAALLLHWPSMEVHALAGSADFHNERIQGQVDGTRARRSPGSALKPFIYALALDQGLIHPMTLLADSPRSFAGYDPENFDRTFKGPLPAGEALRLSRNLPAISLASRLRNPDLYAFLRSAGADLPNDAEHYGLSLVLGGAEVTMRELARMYAMLADRGRLRPLRLVRESHERGIPDAPLRLLSPEAAFITLSMLKEDGEYIVSFGRRVPVYKKTGTSNGFRDAWTAGIVGQYVLVVWAGNFDNTANPMLTGSGTAAPLFMEAAAALGHLYPLEDKADQGRRDLRLRHVEVCRASGDLDTALCGDTVQTLFIPGVSPVRSSGIFRTILIDRRTGLRACAPVPGHTEERVWEFRPTDMRQIFLQAGIVKAPPPPFGPECAAGASPDAEGIPGEAPRIRIPKAGVTYRIQLSDPARSRIPLSADADADAGKVFWFAGDSYLGSVKPGEHLLWTPPTGVTELRAVDDLGRAGRQTLRVLAAP